MNQEEFITAVKIVVHDSSINGMKTTLSRPPGRNPHKKLKELSLWFNSLPEKDKQQLMEVIRLTVHDSIFGILCVLDGVSAIESTSDKGELRLTFIKDGKAIPLNGPQLEMLHDVYQTQVQDEVFGK